MNIAYFSRPHRKSQTSGGNAHVGQFLDRVIAAGHQVWTSQPDDRADTHTLPAGRLARLLRLRQMDVLYFRLEWQARSQCRLGLPPYRALLSRPIVAWELNTVPEYGRLLGHTSDDVARAETELQRLAAGCDIAFAVWPAIEEYARRVLGLRHVVTIPNGSDPERFSPAARPALPPVAGPDPLRVVWVGSATLGWHDLDTIRSAAARLERDGWGRRIEFHLIGRGTQEGSDAGANIMGHGEVAYHLLPGFLAAMQVGLSLYKPGPASFGPGLKTFDYMASGLAMIAYDQPAFRSLFAEMETPNPVVPTGDADALIEALKRLYHDRAHLAACGRAGRQLVVKRYNWAATVSQTLAELTQRLPRT
ncbi:MAG: glycosyltransferase [Lentisphaerae bacterium]|nr:glycosyltransferase [Lentisphaerota bacterium]